MKHNDDKRKSSRSILTPQNEGYKNEWTYEYQMMRDELVKYMDMLQTVRNMMYISVAAAFAFAFSASNMFICSLLPLVFIIPAYSCAVNYWLCVRKASAYLVVFHESYKDCPYHWESRHNMLRHDNHENFKTSTFFNIASQLASYFVCASLTMFFYFFRMYILAVNYLKDYEEATFWDIKINDIGIIFYIVIGIIALGFTSIFFVKYSNGKSYNDLLADFLTIKNNEIQTRIGKCWKNGEALLNRENQINQEITEVDEYMSEIQKYL
jgi:hypothetical protein